MFDVIIVGGGIAGLSAGLVLGRFRRAVLICDSGKPRNAKSHGVHNFLSRDGILPNELLQIARSQLQPYNTVELRSQKVVDIVPNEQHFEVSFADGSREQARKILFATGVKDHLPPITGMDDLFGAGVFHCPYCDGWEARDKAIAILANGETALHFGKLLHALTNDLVLCTNGASEISEADMHRFDELGIRIITTPVAHINMTDAGLEGLTFADGTHLERDVIFLKPAQSQSSPLLAKLGCAFTDGGYVKVDEQGKTNVAGIFAAGDLTTPTQAVVYAASKGVSTAAAINYELAQEVFLRETSR
jgi:thioredoxin reductase